MDTLWKENGLDLRMTTYKCFPTLKDQGLIEFVQVCVHLSIHIPQRGDRVLKDLSFIA